MPFNGDKGGPSGNIGRFQYTGQAWIPELGMYYYKARIYSPTLGRFMQSDPIGYGDGMNMYAYVGNDPVNGTDPSGLCEVSSGTGSGINTCIQQQNPGEIVITGRRWECMACNSSLSFLQSTRITDLLGSLGAARQAVRGDTPGRGVAEQDKPQSPRLKPSTKKYMCGELSASGFDLPKTYDNILKFRQGKTNGKSNWFVPEPRQAENFLYATGNHRSPPSDGSTRIGVYLHQYVKPFFDSSSPYSEDALNAGLEGVKHAEITAGELKEYCNAK